MTDNLGLGRIAAGMSLDAMGAKSNDIDGGIDAVLTEPHDRGTISSGTETPEITNGMMQVAVNNGAHTLAAPTGTGAYVLTYTNGASAGTITALGWDSVTLNGEDSPLEHTVENSIIECAAYNDGVAKRLIVTLIVDAT